LYGYFRNANANVFECDETDKPERLVMGLNHVYIYNASARAVYVHTADRNDINSVTVTTPPASDSALNQPQVISLLLNDGSRLVATHKFTYRLDPRFTNIEPRNHLIVYVNGNNVNIYIKR